jgi:hypothetical protein
MTLIDIRLRDHERSPPIGGYSRRTCGTKRYEP